MPRFLHRATALILIPFGLNVGITPWPIPRALANSEGIGSFTRMALQMPLVATQFEGPSGTLEPRERSATIHESEFLRADGSLSIDAIRRLYATLIHLRDRLQPKKPTALKGQSWLEHLIQNDWPEALRFAEAAAPDLSKSAWLEKPVLDLLYKKDIERGWALYELYVRYAPHYDLFFIYQVALSLGKENKDPIRSEKAMNVYPWNVGSPLDRHFLVDIKVALADAWRSKGNRKRSRSFLADAYRLMDYRWWKRKFGIGDSEVNYASSIMNLASTMRRSSGFSEEYERLMNREFKYLIKKIRQKQWVGAIRFATSLLPEMAQTKPMDEMLEIVKRIEIEFRNQKYRRADREDFIQRLENSLLPIYIRRGFVSDVTVATTPSEPRRVNSEAIVKAFRDRGDAGKALQIAVQFNDVDTLLDLAKSLLQSHPQEAMEAYRRAMDSFPGQKAELISPLLWASCTAPFALLSPKITARILHHFQKVAFRYSSTPEAGPLFYLHMMIEYLEKGFGQETFHLSHRLSEQQAMVAA